MLIASEHNTLNFPKLVITFRIILKGLPCLQGPRSGCSPPLWFCFPPLLPCSLGHCSRPHRPSCCSSKRRLFLAQDLNSPSRFTPAFSLASFSSVFKWPLIRESLHGHPILKLHPSSHHPSLSSWYILLHNTYCYLPDYKPIFYVFTIDLPHETEGTSIFFGPHYNPNTSNTTGPWEVLNKYLLNQ